MIMTTVEKEREALKRGHELRARFREGGRFREQDFREALHVELKDLDNDGLDLADWAADVIDADALADRPPGPSGFDLEGEYDLRDGGRIAKPETTREMFQEHLEVARERVEKAQQELREAVAAADRKAASKRQKPGAD
jgi:hypothetical protein